jgi:hypothetical protein
MAKRGPSHIDRRSQDGGPKTAAPTTSGDGGAGIDRIDRDGALFAFSLADSHGNPLDDVDPVSALVPGFFAIERLRFSRCVRRAGAQLVLAGARPTRCSTMSSRGVRARLPGPRRAHSRRRRR